MGTIFKAVFNTIYQRFPGKTGRVLDDLVLISIYTLQRVRSRCMCKFVVPLCVRMKGHVTTREGLSLLGGPLFGSRFPGSEAYYCLFDMLGWCGEGPFLVE